MDFQLLVDSSVSLAIGSAWSENPDELRLSMHIAEETSSDCITTYIMFLCIET